MQYVEIQLSAKEGGNPVVINVATITGRFRSMVGRTECTVVRTIDGNEWLVRETLEEISTLIDSASVAATGTAPLKLETKKAKGAK